MTSHHYRDLCELHKINPERQFIPPVYQQILGSWLRVTGISDLAMRGYLAAVNLGIASALVMLFLRYRISAYWSVPPLLVLILFGYIWGMRAEGTGILLLFWGIVFLLRRDGPGAFGAGACLIASGLVLQQAGIYAGILILLSLWDVLTSKNCQQTKWKVMLMMMLGASIPTLMFLAGIGWDLDGFIHTFHTTLRLAAGIDTSRMSIVSSYWFCATMGWEWAKLLAMLPMFAVVIAGVAMIRSRLERLIIIALVTGLFLNLLVVGCGAYRLSFIYCVFLFAAVILIGASKTSPLRWRILPLTLCPLVMLALALPSLCSYYRRLPGNEEAVFKAISKPGIKALFFDTRAAISVFGWQLPENMQSLTVGKIAPCIPPREGDFFIFEKAQYSPIPLHMLGRDWNSTTVNCWQWDVVDFRGCSSLSGEMVGFPRFSLPLKVADGFQ